jgi:hypothetical protein
VLLHFDLDARGKDNNSTQVLGDTIRMRRMAAVEAYRWEGWMCCTKVWLSGHDVEGRTNEDATLNVDRRRTFN